MSASPELAAVPGGIDPDTPRVLRPLAQALWWANRGLVVVGMLALLAAAVVLTSSVVSRYFMHASTDWQDEAAVFSLVGATFLCSAFVQALRGHVGIEAIGVLLPAGFNRVRLLLVDLVAMLFCAFFAWKSVTLFHEAYAEHHTTSSSWAPPLAIPYGLMAAGMILLSLQLLVQFAARINGLVRRAEPAR